MRAINHVIRRIVIKPTSPQQTTTLQDSSSQCNYANNYYGDQCCAVVKGDIAGAV